MHLLRACLWHSHLCSAPIHLDAYALHKGPGNEAGKDERELGKMGRETAEFEYIDLR